ncbi:MAG: aminoacyl-tRNA hydrolase [Candidatus Taylorbacteria bacterium]|nr:aminoacyl-tRNA hydrolase [Candidatus Taylorbacteria bacterium]
MSYIIVALGNPGAEYENTRHNTGRIVLDVFAKANDFPEFAPDKKFKALISEGKVGKTSVLLLEPESFMNNSGESLKKIKDFKFKLSGKGKDKIKEVTNLAVIHDDLDIPFGSYKISFNKSSGGHRGVESIIKAVKTQAFVRIRVGIASSSSVVKKSQDEETVNKVILGKFSPDQMAELKKLSKSVSPALSVLLVDGREKAMSQQGSY